MIEPNPADVREMFDALAPAYDRFNFLSSLGLDAYWRRRAARDVRSGDAVLDLGCGTGDLALAAWRRAAPRGRVTGVDFSAAMLAEARIKAAGCPPDRVTFVEGSADRLPFAEGAFDRVVSAFVLRSLAGIRTVVAGEVARVLRPGGTACLLELTRPSHPLLRGLHRRYLGLMVPSVGRLAAGSRWPEGYLASTILEFPEPEDYGRWFASAGLDVVDVARLTGGIASVLRVRKP